MCLLWIAACDKGYIPISKHSIQPNRSNFISSVEYRLFFTKYTSTFTIFLIIEQQVITYMKRLLYILSMNQIDINWKAPRYDVDMHKNNNRCAFVSIQIRANYFWYIDASKYFYIYFLYLLCTVQMNWETVKKNRSFSFVVSIGSKWVNFKTHITILNRV